MTLPQLDMSTYKVRGYESCSSLSCYARCPRRRYYRYGLRLRTPEHPALRFGKAIHAGLPYCYFGEVDKALEEFDGVWDESLADKKRSRRRAQGMFLEFHSTHSPEHCQYELIDPPEGIIKRPDMNKWECPFALDLGVGVPIVGIVDAPVRHKRTGRKWGAEFKTSSGLGYLWPEQFDLCPQTAIYGIALSGLNKEPCEGMFYEGLLVASVQFQCLSLPIYISDTTLEDGLDWVRWVVAGIRACEKTGVWNKNLAGCTTYASFGSSGYPCEFRQLCQSPEPSALYDLYEVTEEKDFVIEGEFEVD